MAEAAETVLELTGVEASYGRIPCLRGVDLKVRRGSIVALIGANGAGKTTTLRAISGLLRPSAGTIRYQGQVLGRLAAHERVRRGIVQVPEGRAILGRMSVLENLELGAFGRLGRAGRSGRSAETVPAVDWAEAVESAQSVERVRSAEAVRPLQSVRDDLAAVLERFPRLAERRRQLAGTLSGGEQQMLAIARALMARPEIILMDEPSMGLAPRIVAEVFALIETIHREGTTILLVEQNARQALAVADWAYVLETGRTVLSGPAGEVRHDQRVTVAYLGGE